MNSKGLKLLKPDSRDYSHHAIYGTLGAAKLPTNDFTIYDQISYTIQWGDTLSKIALKFHTSIQSILAINIQIKNPNIIFTGQVITIPARQNEILNQLDLDFCTAFASVELQNALWGQQFDPYYQMAKICQVMGTFSGYGADLRDAANSVVKYGSLPILNAPYQYPGQTRDFLANWVNYPTGLDEIAVKEKDLSYFSVDGTNDMFDNIRSILFMHMQERRALTFGLFWHESWTEVAGGIIPDVMPNDSEGGGHDIAIVGQKTINGELYLVAQNTWGETAGDHAGYYYFPRSIINACTNEGYGAYTFSSINPSGMTGSGFMTQVATFFNKLMGFI